MRAAPCRKAGPAGRSIGAILIGPFERKRLAQRMRWEAMRFEWAISARMASFRGLGKVWNEGGGNA